MPEEPHADFSGCVDPLDQCRARVVQARHFDLYALRPEVLNDFVERRHCGDVPEMPAVENANVLSVANGERIDEISAEAKNTCPVSDRSGFLPTGRFRPPRGADRHLEGRDYANT